MRFYTLQRISTLRAAASDDDTRGWLAEADEKKGIGSIEDAYALVGGEDIHVVKMTRNEYKALTTRKVEVLELMCNRLYSEDIACGEWHDNTMLVSEQVFIKHFS